MSRNAVLRCFESDDSGKSELSVKECQVNVKALPRRERETYCTDMLKKCWLLGFAFVAIFMLTGCGEKQPEALIGCWSMGNVELKLEQDGTFVLSNGAQETKGEFELLNSNGMLVLAYQHGGALRRMITGYTISEDGQTLAINRTFFGTLVLNRKTRV